MILSVVCAAPRVIYISEKATMLLTDPRIKHSKLKTSKKKAKLLCIRISVLVATKVTSLRRIKCSVKLTSRTLRTKLNRKTSFTMCHKFKSQHYSPLNICFAIVCHEQHRAHGRSVCISYRIVLHLSHTCSSSAATRKKNNNATTTKNTNDDDDDTSTIQRSTVRGHRVIMVFD